MSSELFQPKSRKDSALIRQQGDSETVHANAPGEIADSGF